MKILVAPLNWGLGHASRCVPLVHRFLNEGHEVILGGDGESLTLLRKHFPTLRYVYLAPLNLRYSKGTRQVWAMVKALPKLIAWSVKDHTMLAAVLREEAIDRVISDNRFGLYSKKTECIYITHQVRIMLPDGWRWAERIAARLHARIYARFNKVWIPDYEDMDKSLAGELSHINYLTVSPSNGEIIEGKDTNQQSPISDYQYIGPLSRFSGIPHPVAGTRPAYDVVAVLSGLEPHRSLLEQEMVMRYADKEDTVLIVQGLMNRPYTRIKRGNITLVPYMPDTELIHALIGAKHIIARSGYSSIMDFDALGVLGKTELMATPGQPEQEYLAHFIAEK